MKDEFLNPVRKSEQSSAPDLYKDNFAEKNSSAAPVGFFSVSEKKPTGGFSNGVKLTNTVYKLLEFFPESDPLKNKAKDKVLAIMSAFGGSAFGGENSGDWLAVGEFFSAEREKKKIQILQDIDILLGYFEIGKSQRWLSGINCLIICREYEKIKKEIGSPVNSAVISAKAEIQSKTTFLDSRLRGNDISKRQKEIIKFLEQNEKAQVMDLQAVLPDVTKRTIRRDLDELLELGKITRLGEFNQIVYKISRKNAE